MAATNPGQDGSGGKTRRCGRERHERTLPCRRGRVCLTERGERPEGGSGEAAGLARRDRRDSAGHGRGDNGEPRRARQAARAHAADCASVANEPRPTFGGCHYEALLPMNRRGAPQPRFTPAPTRPSTSRGLDRRSTRHATRGGVNGPEKRGGNVYERRQSNAFSPDRFAVSSRILRTEDGRESPARRICCG